MNYCDIPNYNFPEPPDSFTVDLGKEEHYLFSENPDEISVFKYSNDYIPGYRVYIHTPPRSGSFSVRKFLYGGEDEGLPRGLENVLCIFIAFPEGKLSRLSIMVVMQKTGEDGQEENILCFRRDAEGRWEAYVYENYQFIVDWHCILKDLISYPLLETCHFSYGKFHRVSVDSSKVSETPDPQGPMGLGPC